MKAPVYLDHAATTPVRREVLDAMLPYLGSEAFGNPSSAHRFGRAARAGLDHARQEVAEAVGAEPNQVIFTSGGTEADNLALLGSCLAAREAGRPMGVVVSAIEHKAILAAAHVVVQMGGRETLVPVDGNGQVDLAALRQALKTSPTIASIMWVNNETGAIQPIARIAEYCAEAGVALHSDAVQAFGKLPVCFRELGAAALTISGHKIGAPKGIGALVLRERRGLEAMIHGGGQQYGLRPGTENVPGAVGLGRAARLVVEEREREAERLERLRDDLAGRLREAVPDLVVNAERGPRAPHVLSVAVPGTDSEALLMHLDLAGIAASGGSACSTGAVEPSHVLIAMGISRELALGALRFSLGHESQPEDIARVVEVFPGVVAKVRRLAEALGRA